MSLKYHYSINLSNISTERFYRKYLTTASLCYNEKLLCWSFCYHLDLQTSLVEREKYSMKNTIQTHSFIAGVVKGYFQKLLYTQSASTLFHSYKRLLAPLTCGRFISNASLVVSSCSTSAPVGTEILYCLPVQSRSWSYANFLSPSIIKNFFFLQKKEIQFLPG